MNRLLRLFQDASLRKKLIFSYVAVIIIPIGILGAYSYRSAKDDLERQLRQSADYAADQLVSELSYRFDRQEYPIKSIVFNPKVVRAVSDTDDDVYELAVELNEDVEPIFWNYLYFMSEMKEIVIYSEHRNTAFGNFFQPSHTVQGQTWYEQTGKSKATQWWSDGTVLFAARNIYEPGREQRQGVLYIRFDFDKMISEVAGKSGLAEAVVIEDRSGRTIFASSKEGWDPVDADSYYVLRRTLPRTDWVLHYYIGTRHIEEGTANIAEATLIIIVLCMSVLFGIILLFSRTLLHGIRKLNERMRRVEEGELDVAIPTMVSKDEVGQLTVRFANMIKQINHLIQEAYESRIARKDAELRSLQAQINPHFLYNSLSLINAQAIERDAYDISHTVNLLARFYRTTLNKGKELISVRDELTNVRTYIDIQRMMCGCAFDAHYELDEEIYRYDIVHLVLQPIVENAIDHGLKEKPQGNRTLTISGKIKENDLILTVEDNGVGMEERVRARLLTSQSSGYGLNNIQDRLLLFFGEPYGLTITSSPGTGTKVEMCIPCGKAETFERKFDRDR